MIWGEQDIRDKVRVGVGAARAWSFLSSVTYEETERLLNEIDMLRSYLQRIQSQAQGHVDDQEPGWGRWQTTVRLTKEALE